MVGLFSFLAVFGAFSLPQEASADALWTRVSFAPSRPAFHTEAAVTLEAQAQEAFRLNPERLRQVLSDRDRAGTELVLSLPTEGGRFEDFRVARVQGLPSSLEEELDMETWAGVCVANPNCEVWFTRIGDQVRAEVDDRRVYQAIEPVEGTLHSVTSAYGGPRTMPFACGAPPSARPGSAPARAWSGSHRVLRIAIACTGEYWQTRGGKKADVAAAIQHLLGRLNRLYSRELGVSFVPVEGIDQLWFSDPETDGLDNNDDRILIKQSQERIDDLIGPDNYDIGHTLSTGAGGRAAAGVGVDGVKAQGVTGSSTPFGPSFDVDYVAHEIGHQFGANHTFNGTLGACSRRNWSKDTAFEPGAGLTIMSYAGICGDDNYVGYLNSEPYFHAASLAEMHSYLETVAHLLPEPTTGANEPPEVDAGPDFVVPPETPFRLRPARVRDPEGDALLFSWEQYDLGPQSQLGKEDPADGPLFRSSPPSYERTRTLPSMETLRDGSVDRTERLSPVGRPLNFRLTVRERDATQRRGIAWDDVVVTVTNNEPLRVDFPPAPVLRARQVPVRWTGGRVESPFVRILLSDDDGETFSPLVARTPNDGVQMVSLASFGTNPMRIMVESDDGRFFALSEPFYVLRSNASVMFLPDESGPTRDQVERIWATRHWDEVIWVEPAGLTSFREEAPTGQREPSTTMLERLKRAWHKGKARTVLAVGRRAELFRTLEEWGGKPNAATGVAVLTFQDQASLFESYSHGEAKIPFSLQATAASENWGNLEFPIDLFERQRLLNEVLRTEAEDR